MASGVYAGLAEEIVDLDGRIGRPVKPASPSLVALDGVGSAAATLLIVAGDNPKRTRSEVTFARLCGPVPIPASVGRGGGGPPRPTATAKRTGRSTWSRLTD